MSEYRFCKEEGCNGKVALASGWCTEMEPDQEPFKSGELIDLERNFTWLDIDVHAHICTECETIQDVWVDNEQYTAMKTKTEIDLEYAIGYLEAEADSIKENYKGSTMEWRYCSQRYMSIKEAIKILENARNGNTTD